MLELISVLVMTHITIICVTVYLHRSQTHLAVTLSHWISHPMRLWLWMSTGMLTKEWVAVHRKHHQTCETPNDPHSPQVHGIWKVLFGGAWLYVQAKQDRKMIEQYGRGTPDDWVERNLYTRYPKLGFLTLLAIELLIFGWAGLIIWAVQMIWVPFHAAGVINGVGHYWGYKNGPTPDCSRNIFPIGIWIGGEELHSNHHERPASAKLSHHWWEFDAGWMYIKIFEFFHLAKVKTI